MSHQEQLRDELLALQGQTSEPSEADTARFRQQLAEEERRAKRLGWLVQIPMWLWVGALGGLCMSERLWERLHIPFTAAGFILMAIWVGGGLPIMMRGVRRLKQSRQTAQRLNKLMPEYVPPTVQAGTLMVRCGSQRYVHWLKLVCFAVVLWLLVALGGILGNLVLMQRFTPAPVLSQSAIAIVGFLGIVFVLLRTPLEDLTAARQVNRFFWWPVPDLSA
jgi:hypothetical protein